MRIHHSMVAAIFLVLSATAVFAGPRYSFKIASLAPEGSVWVTHFRNFAAEIAERSNNEIAIRIYPGGVMGDDLAMYRKMRVGQLDGGGFTMTGIAHAVPDFRVMAVPFLFNTYEEIDHTSKELLPYFTQQFSDKGLELLALTEVGFIYGMSKQPTSTIDDLKKRKSWIPSGDPVTAAYLKGLSITPVPLSIPDVLSSLQTGLIDTVYTSLYGTIVMQWFTKATFITDIPYGYAYGGVIFSKRAFSRLPANYQEIVHQSAQRHFSALNQQTRKTNQESREVLLQNGVSFVPASSNTREVLVSNRDTAIKELMGKAFSKRAYDLLSAALEDYRKDKP